jgi:hypothetical protein
VRPCGLTGATWVKVHKSNQIFEGGGVFFTPATAKFGLSFLPAKNAGKLSAPKALDFLALLLALRRGATGCTLGLTTKSFRGGERSNNF